MNFTSTIALTRFLSKWRSVLRVSRTLPSGRPARLALTLPRTDGGHRTYASSADGSFISECVNMIRGAENNGNDDRGEAGTTRRGRAAWTPNSLAGFLQPHPPNGWTAAVIQHAVFYKVWHSSLQYHPRAPTKVWVFVAPAQGAVPGHSWPCFTWG